MGARPSGLYVGHGVTPEDACAALEQQLQAWVHPDAFVTLSKPMRASLLSPRQRQFALANLYDGSSPQAVELSGDDTCGYEASVRANRRRK
jgi:hypothetical protein